MCLKLSLSCERKSHCLYNSWQQAPQDISMDIMIYTKDYDT
jgi:hypothetical protein